MLVKVICDILLYHSSWLLLFTLLHTGQLILQFYLSQFPGEVQLPTLTFRATFLKLQAMVVILIQLDRSLFSHSQLILCVTAMRHGWLCLPLLTLQRLHLPAYGPGPHLSPPGLPTSAQGTDPFQPPGLPPGISQQVCACAHPHGAGAAAVPSPSLLLAVSQDGTGGQILPAHGPQGVTNVLQVLLETQEDSICRYIKITLAGVGNRCQCSDILSYLFPSSTL